MSPAPQHREVDCRPSQPLTAPLPWEVSVGRRADIQLALASTGKHLFAPHLQGWKAAQSKGPIYLFFSVNASGQFCGCAQMTSSIDYKSKLDCWADDKWSGKFSVKWVFIKDIPNSHFRHIILENNENKPVTNSRDTQEVPMEKGKEMLSIFRCLRPQ